MRYDLTLSNIEIKNVTQRKVFILGGTGSGKTTTLKMLALNCPVTAYVFDFLDVITIKGFQKISISKGMIVKAKEAGLLFNRLKIKKGIIFSFKNMLQKEITDFCDSFFSTWKPHDCVLFFDEIHDVVPEMSGTYSKETERLIRHGRNNNVGFIADSQRPALVSKNVLALTDFLICFRTTWEHDLRVIDNILSNSFRKEQRNPILNKLQASDFLCGIVIDFQPHSYEIKNITALNTASKSQNSVSQKIFMRQKRVYRKKSMVST